MLSSCRSYDADNTGKLDSLGKSLIDVFETSGSHRTSFHTPDQSCVTYVCDSMLEFDSEADSVKLSDSIRSAIEECGYDVKLHISGATVRDGNRSWSAGIASFIANDYGNKDYGHTIGDTGGTIIGKEKFTSTTVGSKDGSYTTISLLFIPENGKLSLVLTN